MILDPQPVFDRLSRCPRYRETPLVSVGALASVIGVENVWLKDESERMELGSFKALGGAYAVARLVESSGSNQTFCCASAGNHGLSVAAGAQAFGARAVIFLSDKVPTAFARRIQELGADVVRAGTTYEESMLEALKRSEREGWVLVSDSSWTGYTDIPRLIMEGYTVIAAECGHSFRVERNWPSVVFLQAGVGGLAAAITRQIREDWDEQPTIVVVEPEKADCLGQSYAAQRPTAASGGVSNMGRLDCKEPSILAFEILRDEADQFTTVTDTEALESSRVLTRLGFSTTPSGAAGLAGAVGGKLSRSSRVLIILTEGSE